MPLALLLMRTDTTAHGRKIALVVDYFHGIAKVSHRQLMYPVRNVMAYRTPLLALRNLAMQATLGLVDGFKHGITFVNLMKKLLLFLHFSTF